METIRVMKEDNGEIIAVCPDEDSPRITLAKITDGLLDVRRPKGYLRPEGIKATPKTLAAVFGKWFLNECCGDPILSKTVKYGDDVIRIPKCPNDDPVVFLYDESEATIFHFVGRRLFRVGVLTEKSTSWIYADATTEFREGIHPAFSRSSDPDSITKQVLNSFKGSFASSVKKAQKKTKASQKKRRTPPVRRK
ncbi:MAG: hypothetical protein GF334_08775 [Candidatus Altiarchaeales archaeon]|nr:hypothetical protein [Candidatus Altiarchaeales archaeon]